MKTTGYTFSLTFSLALLGTISLTSLGSRPTPVALPGSGPGAPEVRAGLTDPTRTRVLDLYDKLPLSFEANHGQTDPQVRFLSRGRGHTLFLTPTEAVLALRKPAKPVNADHVLVPGREIAPEGSESVAVRLRLVGANPDPEVSGLEALPGRSNYFIGNDPSRWRTDIPHYATVAYTNVYPGIDLVYHSSPEASARLEYDFIVAPGADPNAITLRIEGAEKLALDARGNLVLGIAGDEIHQPRPLIYQELGRVRREVAGGYVIQEKNQVNFQVAAYDPRKPLIIDPVLTYSTYLGGSDGDEGFGIAVDATGAAYVTGFTLSTNFPTTSGAFDTSFNGSGDDVFVTKLNATGSAPLIYSTYLGGSGQDLGFGIAVDATGAAYVTGWTNSTDFPTTSGAFDTSFNGSYDVFVTKITDVQVPATLTLDPATAANDIGTQHCVTATVKDALGSPVPNVTVRFIVTGSVNTSGSLTTDANGQAIFCYFGPPLPGADAITAFADSNNDGDQDVGEPSGAASKAWVFPLSTPGKVTGGGFINPLTGDPVGLAEMLIQRGSGAGVGGKANFGFVVEFASGDPAPTGNLTYHDHGADVLIKAESFDVLLITGTHARFIGTATVNGVPGKKFQVDVDDLGEPGSADTFSIEILEPAGYMAAGVLIGGNIQIHPAQ